MQSTVSSVFRRPWLILFLVACLAAAASPLAVSAQTDENPTLSVVVEALNVRSGPGVNYPVIGVLARGDQVAVTGRHAPSGWWQVQLDDGRTGWVSGGAAYVQVSGDTRGVPNVAAPSTSAPQAQARSGGTIVFQTASGGPIYAIDPGSTNLRYLTTGIDPALSPDGQQMAFTRWENPELGAQGNLWLINLDGTGERAILGDVNQPKSPAWSPDGAKIAISMQQGGRLQPEYKCSSQFPSDAQVDIESIHVVIDDEGDVKFCFALWPHPQWGLRMVEVATGRFEDLPHDLFSYTPAWDTANAWHLVYDGEQGLVNLDLNRGTTWALTDDTRDYTPAFSPDGSRLAVAYKQHDHWDIHVMNADGSGRVRLTETPLRAIVEQRLKGQEPRPSNNVAPTWSPDGSQIAFLTDRSGQWEIWVMNADGSNQRPMFPPETLDGLGLQYNFVGERSLSWR